MTTYPLTTLISRCMELAVFSVHEDDASEGIKRIEYAVKTFGEECDMLTPEQLEQLKVQITEDLSDLLWSWHEDK